MPLVPLKRTPIAMSDYCKALLKAWQADLTALPTKQGAGVLWAQFMMETGGQACWNFNLGNVKVTQAQVDAGVDWIDLSGTWEVVGGKRVVLPDGHPGRRFRAYETLAEAMREHLRFLRNKRYAVAWPAVEAGNPDVFARRLKIAGYYTAPADQYAAGMVAHHRRWMSSLVYEQAVAELLAQMEAETQPELPKLCDADEEPEGTTVVRLADFSVVHPPVPLERDPDDAA
jgi:hypothetical protein